MNQAALDRLIEVVRALPSSPTLMNPYASAKSAGADGSRDEVGPEADEVRTHNLRAYLTALLERGSDLLMAGEAPGFQGARYSGVAFTSEREIVAGGFPFGDCRSLPSLASGARPYMKEPSAKIVWEALSRAERPAVLWNAVPLHPNPGRADKNRTPTRQEVALGAEPLEAMIDLVRPRLIVAIGETAKKALLSLNPSVPVEHVRHPAYGGKPHFMRGLQDLGLIAPPPINPQQSLF